MHILQEQNIPFSPWQSLKNISRDDSLIPINLFPQHSSSTIAILHDVWYSIIHRFTLIRMIRRATLAVNPFCVSNTHQIKSYLAIIHNSFFYTKYTKWSVCINQAHNNNHPSLQKNTHSIGMIQSFVLDLSFRAHFLINYMDTTTRGVVI